MCFPEKAEGFLFQKVATGIGCLLCLNYGVLFGITSSNIILYQSTESPLDKTIDAEAASFLGGYLCLGGIVGSLVFGYASDKIGPKSALLLCGLFQIGCWFCMLFGYNIDHIYSSRIAGGLAAGGALAVLPIYIKDISEEKNQRLLEPIIYFFSNAGIFVGFLLTSSTPYEYLPIIGLCLSFIFTMFFPFMPESPYYCMRIGNIAMMEKSLRWLRGIRKIDDRDKPEFLEELKIVSEKQAAPIGKIIAERHYSCLIIISAVLVITYQGCGIFLILNYADTIFQNLSSPMATQWAAVTIAGGQLIGSLFSILMQGHINRNKLVLVTTLSSGISLLILATLMTFENLFELNAQQMQYIPLSILTAFMIIANFGFHSLTFVVISEISAEKIRGRVIFLSMSFMWFLAMLLVKFYYVLNDSIGFAGLLWIFGGFCVLEFFFTTWCVPETRCETFAEIDGVGSWNSSLHT